MKKIRKFIAVNINMSQVFVGCAILSSTILSLDQALMLVTSIYDQIKSAIKQKYVATFEDRRSQLQTTINHTMSDQQMLAIR